MTKWVTYHPQRRCVICGELLKADDHDCSTCGRPACERHAYDAGYGLWECEDCKNGRTRPCAVCALPARWRCADCGEWVCEDDSTFVAWEDGGRPTVWGYLCDADLRWEKGEVRACAISIPIRDHRWRMGF